MPAKQSASAKKTKSEPAPKVDAPKATKQKSEKKVAKQAAPAPAPEPTPAPAPVVAAPVNESVEEVSGFAPVMTRLQEVMGMMTLLKNEVKQLEKRCLREVKLAEKTSGKRKREKGSRPASGFVKPTRISDELATFLGKDKGSEMARTEVTKELNVYIKANKLQDPSNGRTILPDAKLNSLLKVEKDVVLTYFNLQRYMSPHFAKAVKA